MFVVDVDILLFKGRSIDYQLHARLRLSFFKRGLGLKTLLVNNYLRNFTEGAFEAYVVSGPNNISDHIAIKLALGNCHSPAPELLGHFLRRCHLCTRSV